MILKLTTRVRFPSPAPLLALVCLAWCIGTARADEARITLDRPFALVDADGAAVGNGDFPGKYLLIYFGYTHCADQCPTALSAIVAALDEIGPAAEWVQPLFVTVDPERDRGKMLRRFTEAFDRRLVGLTGTPEQIAAVAAVLGVDYAKVLDGGDSGYVVDHSTKLSIIGPDRHTAIGVTLAEPYQIAATLIGILQRDGVPLANVNNLRAWR